MGGPRMVGCAGGPRLGGEEAAVQGAGGGEVCALDRIRAEAAASRSVCLCRSLCCVRLARAVQAVSLGRRAKCASCVPPLLGLALGRGGAVGGVRSGVVRAGLAFFRGRECVAHSRGVDL